MRFLKTFFRFCTIVTLCTTFTTVAWGYATRNTKATNCSSFTTRSTCNNESGCVWTSSTNSTGSYCKQGYCVSTNCDNVPGCNRYTLCEACNEGYYCPGDDGNNDDFKCGAGNYCPTGSASPTPCPAGTYNPSEYSVNLSACTSCSAGKYSAAGASSCSNCPTGYPSSASGSEAQTDCYFNIPATKEYDADTNSNITCHAGGYCPGTKIYYNEAKTDGWGWTGCSDSKIFTNNNPSLTPTSPSGSDYQTDCYVVCPDKTIANGTVIPFNHQTYPSLVYAIYTGSKFTYNECQYKLDCHEGYNKNKEVGTISSLSCNLIYYTIKYYEGSIVLSNLTPTSYTIETETFNLPSPLAVPGYTFAGWYTNTNFSGSAVSQITKGTTGNKTFYVRRIPNTYNLSYDLSGGTSGGNQPATATYNTQFTVSNPTRTGYTFAGWNITGMDSVTHTYDSSTTTNISISGTKATSFKNLHSTSGATVTFTATWTANTYSLSYDLSSGTAGASKPATAMYDTAFTVSNPTLTGYTFAGWNITGMDSVTHTYGSSTTTSTSISGTKATSFKNLHSTSGATVTFTATWTANTYNLSYNLSGGTAGASKPATAMYDTQFTVSKPTRTGYDFNGWNITGMNTGVTHYYGVNNALNTTTAATVTTNTNDTQFKNLHSTSGATVTFTATWGAQECAVTYNCGDGTGTPPSATTIMYDSSYTTDGLGGCKKPGYYFSGWKVNSTDTILAQSTKINPWQYTGTTTLTAQWKECTAGHYCTGTTTAEESCPDAFTSAAVAKAKEECYLNPGLTLKDSINEGGVKLNTLPGSANKIYYVKPSSQQ